MKTCWPRPLLGVVLVLSFSLTTLGVNGSGTPGAVLQAAGKVHVNGADSLAPTRTQHGAAESKKPHAQQPGQEMGKGTSQTQRPVSLQRTGCEVGRRIRRSCGFEPEFLD
jgi:hypothetical protein